MKNHRYRFAAVLLLAAIAIIPPSSSYAAENLTDALEIVRSTYATDRQVFVAENMQLSEKESASFWPLYRQYRAARESLGDELVKVVREYADAYPGVSEDRAHQLLKQSGNLEKKLLSQRQSYLKKFGKILPAAKVLKFAQLENRMDIALRVQLASVIPMVHEAKAK